jgi:hypothetical protein
MDAIPFLAGCLLSLLMGVVIGRSIYKKDNK